jgi:transposase-like protein
METLYVWLLTFAGATMVGCFLSSERELGKQRREINWLRRNHRPSEGSETHASAELMTRNKELVETISSLSAQLEESKRTVEELQCEQRQLVSAGELNQELQASQKTIKELEAEQHRLGSKENIQMAQPVCPQCSSDYVERVSRIGLERLITRFYIYPFRCQPCGHRFRLFQWGVTYTRIELDSRATQKRRPTRVW